MAVTPYSTDTDLQVYEPDILALGVSDWDNYHLLAAEDLNRELKAKWWPEAIRAWASRQIWDPYIKATAAELEFDPQYFKTPDQLKQAACYRVLGWYAYELLAKYGDSEPDRYEKKKEVYQAKFSEEMGLVIGSGLDYDFTRDGVLDTSEKGLTSSPRRARRG